MIWKSFEPLALTKEITRSWTALVNTWQSQMYAPWSVQPTQSWSPASKWGYSASSSTAKCREKTAVLFIVICIPTVPTNPALGYET